MIELYQSKINRLENEYAYWMDLAKKEYIRHDNTHSKQECVYYQHAADVCSQMASLSTGAEQDFQNRRRREIDGLIKNAIMEFDPGYFQRVAAKKADKNGNDNASAKTSGSSSSDDEVNVDEDWFKEIPSISFDENVMGMEDLKKRLMALAADSNREKIMEYLGIQKEQSFLLYGPPGTGKTHLVKAFVHELAKCNPDKNYTFMLLECSDILSKYVGDAEKIVQKIFETALEKAPCILFIDELDGICKNRSMANLPEYASSITTAFLTAYNRLKGAKEQIIFIGATNYPANIDKAMVDRMELIEVSYPDAKARTAVIMHQLKDKIQLAGGLTEEQIAEMTEGPVYNYRDVDKLCNGIKLLMMEQSLQRFGSQEMAIEMMKTGKFGLSRSLLKMAVDNNPPQNHTRSDKEIEFFKKGGWE